VGVRAADGSEHEVTAAEIAAARSTTPQRLRRELAGDLGAIVLQALQPEVGERYPSVEALAEDLRRFRTGLPVRARPATLRYRVGKLVRRHRVAVAAGGLALASLLLGLSASLWQARVAARERDSARRSAARAEQVAGFLSGLFELSEPERARGQMLTAREIIDRGAAQIGVELADQPELQAEMMMLIGEVYRQLGLYPESRGLFEKALANRRAVLGEEDAATAESRRRVGLVLHQSGKYDDARPFLEAARDAFERHGDPIGLASALNDLGNLHRATGDLQGARALLERSVALREEHDPGSVALAKTLNNLGIVLSRLDETAEARRIYERALALHEKIGGPESILVAQTLDNLAWIVADEGQPAEAMRLAQRGFAIQQKVLGEHRQLANALNTLGRLAAKTGDRALADAYYRRSVEMFEKTLGPDHPDTAFPVRHLGLGHMERKEPEKALPFFERALAIRLKALGEEHMDVAWSLRDVAGAHAGMGELERALDLYRRSLATWRKTVPAEHPQISETLVRMGRLLEENGRCSEGRPLLDEALALRRAKLADGDPEIAAVEAALGRCTGR
jgi:eukaryotic-like serine/threonine-protein kinase